MHRSEQPNRRVLEEQLDWTKEQIRLLDEMDVKLHEMKGIVEYAKQHDLSHEEIQRLNSKLAMLTDEYNALERLYNPVLH